MFSLLDMKNSTYNVLLFTALNVREESNKIPVWDCKKTYDCRKMTTLDMGGIYKAIPIRKMISTEKTCRCRAGTYTSTCEWRFFSENDIRNEMRQAYGVTTQHCEGLCAGSPKFNEIDQAKECSWRTDGEVSNVRGIRTEIVTEAFDYKKFIKQIRGARYGLTRAEHVIYTGIDFLQDIDKHRLSDARYTVNLDSFQGLDYAWIGDECELVLAIGDEWFLTATNLYYSRNIKNSEIEKILRLEVGSVNMEAERAVVLDNDDELARVCRSYAPERLCEKYAAGVDQTAANRLFGQNVLISKPGDDQAIFECANSVKKATGWSLVKDHYFTTIPASELITLEKSNNPKDLIYPSAIRLNDNYKLFVISNDKNSKQWSRKDVERNITIINSEDHAAPADLGVKYFVLKLGKQIKDYTKNIWFKATVIIIGFWFAGTIIYNIGQWLIGTLCRPCTPTITTSSKITSV